jgi:two-component system, NtrC family, sensor histidine kinase HydH
MDSSPWLFIVGGCLLALIICIATIGIVQRLRFRRAGLIRRHSRGDEKSPEPLNILARELVHEIRNPLNSISLNLQLLEEDLSIIESDNQDDLLKRTRRIRREVDRLDRILTDFRRYARLPSLTLQTCELGRLIEEVLTFNEPEAERQNITIVREIDELPPIQLDPEQFKQALWNLIINAQQAMEDSGTLTVRAKPLNEQVQIDIEDTGNGIDPDVQEKIFELFVSTKDEGTGVGLAIVKQVVEGHGGQISVESQPGQGTTFSIRLPVK